MSNARFFFLYRYLLENTCEGHTAKGEDIRAQYENHEFGSDIRSVYRDIHQLNAPATGLLSVVFYFVIQAVQQIFGVFTLAGLADDSSLLNHLLQNVFSGGRMVIVNGVVSEAPHAVAQFFHGTMLLSLLADLVLGAILYFLTYFMLRKRRNLQ